MSSRAYLVKSGFISLPVYKTASCRQGRRPFAVMDFCRSIVTVLYTHLYCPLLVHFNIFGRESTNKPAQQETSTLFQTLFTPNTPRCCMPGADFQNDMCLSILLGNSYDHFILFSAKELRSAARISQIQNSFSGSIQQLP